MQQTCAVLALARGKGARELPGSTDSAMAAEDSDVYVLGSRAVSFIRELSNTCYQDKGVSKKERI